jgi:hypothetical protein
LFQLKIKVVPPPPTTTKLKGMEGKGREENEEDVNPNLEVTVVEKMNIGSPHYPPFTSINLLKL